MEICIAWIILLAVVGAWISRALLQRRGVKPLVCIVLGAEAGILVGILSEAIVFVLLMASFTD